ncbi:YitT family protein [uncultured Maritalea sp.]|uniref:YitT family protein n=1 Tax=uncultured Maritalea sp. TaxID=757249 RepID=UPI00260B045B|nr:YitT family protein [uncultured Maritalea sp.]
MVEPATDIQHKWHEDVIAIVTGTLLVALGVTLYKHTLLGTGGINGLALLLNYVTPFGFGALFFVLNLPFYWLAWKRLGPSYTIKTFGAVALVSVLVQVTPTWISFEHLNPYFATIIGGILMGTGLLILFRHKAGLGGVNILAVFLQENYGIRAGYLQMGIDMAILVGAFFVLPIDKVLLSIVGALVLNLVIAMNFRPGRYVGFSGAFVAEKHSKK